VTICFWRTICVLTALALNGQSPAFLRLEGGMVLDRSLSMRPRTYRLSVSPETVSANRLDVISGRAIDDAVPRDRFALVAEGTTTLPQGNYTLQVSDDGVRVWMDGAMILDEWAPHQSKVNRVSIRGGGERRFKVEYCDVTGFAELRFDIQRK
jgi:PA14 domain